MLEGRITADTLDSAGAVAAYKGLSNLKRDFRSIKADGLDPRPVFHRLEDLTLHLGKAWHR